MISLSLILGKIGRELKEKEATLKIHLAILQNSLFHIIMFPIN